MRRFFLIPENEEGELYLLCTKPLCLFLVKRDELKLIEGNPDEDTVTDATVFLNNFSFKKIELKRK